MKCDGAPFVYGEMPCSSPAYVMGNSLFVAIVAFSVITKRRSATRPGGRIRRYNQGEVRRTISDRRRRQRDLLNDPVLAKDMERRYGDLSSLRERVEQWEIDGFAIQKKEDNDCVTERGRVVVPWIRSANCCLSVIFFMTFYSVLLVFNVLTVFILFMSLVHIVDNIFLRAAIVRGSGRGPKESKSKGVVAVVAVPVPEVDVGVPAGGVVAGFDDVSP